MKYEAYYQHERTIAANFESKYRLQKCVRHPDPDVLGGGSQFRLDKGIRICRFCGRSKDDGAPFRKRAHVLPEQMGNRLIVSDAECDDCNETFSAYEGDLGEFLGPMKSLLGVEGKRRKGGGRVPTFDDPRMRTRITRSDRGPTLEFDPEQTTLRLDSPTLLTVEIRHHPYTPLRAWKGLARPAVHLLDRDELLDFEWFRKAVSSEAQDRMLAASVGLCVVPAVFMPSMSNVFSRPELRLFERIAPSLLSIEGSLLPEKVFIIHAASHIYQVAVFSDADVDMLADASASVGAAKGPLGLPWYPAVVESDFLERYDFPKRTLHDLGSDQPYRPVNKVQMDISASPPLTREALQSVGFSDQEIVLFRTDGLTGPVLIRRFGSIMGLVGVDTSEAAPESPS